MPAPRLRIAFVALVLSLAAPAGAKSGTESGQLPDNTPYRIDVPENWNGTLFLNLDYAGGAAQVEAKHTRILMSRGYAFAGTTRAITGWQVPRSVDNLAQVAELAGKSFGKPRYVIAFGGSLGGHTSAVAAHLRPDVFQGAIALCGAPAGAIGLWNSKFDALFVAKTLLAPTSDLPITDVPADFQQRSVPAWKDMLAKAQATPEGRARIALAAALAQLPEWSIPEKAEPAPGDLQAREEGLYDSLAGGPLAMVGQAMSSRRQITGLAGGNYSWNDGVDYTAMFDRLSNKALVQALYRQAGLNLAADLRTLAAAPRVRANPASIDYLLPQALDGNFRIPLLTMNNTGDQIGPVQSIWAFQDAARRAGSAPLLRQVVTRSPAHCGFSTGEWVAAAETLMTRVTTGRWPATSAAAMNALAKAADPGPARFIDYPRQPFLRAFDAAAWKARRR